jgi:hypothetical protein
MPVRHQQQGKSPNNSSGLCSFHNVVNDWINLLHFMAIASTQVPPLELRDHSANYARTKGVTAPASGAARNFQTT